MEKNLKTWWPQFTKFLRMAFDGSVTTHEDVKGMFEKLEVTAQNVFEME
jgi:hypothetical protein